MTFPIVQRELLVSARKPLTFWSRIVAALGGFFAVFLIVGFEPNLTAAGALGVKLFRCLAIPGFVACLFGGALLTADCLSVEKREGTLGLLFLTDLKGQDVVFGKLVAHSLAGVFCLLAIVPMLAVPILLGGVTGPDFWRVVLVLFNTAFLSLSVGILASVLSRESRNAFGTAGFIVLVLALLPIGLGLLRPRWAFVPHLFSPLLTFIQAMPARFVRPTHFFSSVLVQHLIGWACLLFASRRVTSSWQDRAAKERPPGWRDRLRGTPAQRLALRRHLLPINPMLWLGSRDWLLPVVITACLFALAVGGWFLNFNLRLGFNWPDVPSSFFTIAVLHFLLTLLVAFDAGGRLVLARQDGALAVVLSTRLTVEEILRGEFLALGRRFRWPLLVVLVFDAVWVFCFWGDCRAWAKTTMAGAIVLCLIVVLIANCYGLAWTALFGGLRAKRPHRAALRAYLKVVILPVLLGGLLVLSGALHDFYFTVVVFTALHLATAWIFGRSAYDRLKHEFREALTEHRPPPQKTFDEDYALLG